MPIEYKDKLGGVLLTPDLIERARNFVPPVIEVPLTPVVEEDLGKWECIDSHLDKDNVTIHRVERRGAALRCTCQDFRIRKNANCEHIVKSKEKLGIA